jgi:NAD(P)-dependent dehydrogenase (short-subunit alcohol dehydrogenase family)
VSKKSPRNWLITGADKGLGLSTAKAALDAGDNVVVTVLAKDGGHMFKGQYPRERLQGRRTRGSQTHADGQADARGRAGDRHHGRLQLQPVHFDRLQGIEEIYARPVASRCLVGANAARAETRMLLSLFLLAGAKAWT